MKNKLHTIFNKKSGFTLIELLVVIGIFAVLAAIAIPAVAGLIDRANVSADKTNSNEMTNALERFASEYELYKNDLAIKGVLPVDEMDAMQGRVYSVIGVNGRSDITELETLGSDNAILINDERYPTTDVLMKKVVEAYTKTSSSTFEPKQSDKCFWYSPECGVVVVAGHNSSVLDKNELVVSGKDAKGNDLDADTVWLDLTPVGSVADDDNGGSGSDEAQPVDNPIPEGGIYIIASTGEQLVGDGVTVAFPEQSAEGDTYRYDGYRYSYGVAKLTINGEVHDTIGWSCGPVADTTLSSYPALPAEINGEPLVELTQTFAGVTEATFNDPNFIPSTVVKLVRTFSEGNVLLPNGLNIPDSVLFFSGVFRGSEVLFGTNTFVIPDTVSSIQEAFSLAGVHGLNKIVIPQNFNAGTGITSNALGFGYYRGIVEIGSGETVSPIAATMTQLKNTEKLSDVVIGHDTSKCLGSKGCKTCSTITAWTKTTDTSKNWFFACITTDNGATVLQATNIYTYDATRDVYVVNADALDTTTMHEHIMGIPVVANN